jgi:WD40 repeat protein
MEIAALHGHSKTVFGVDYSPDGRLIASGSDDSTLRLWNAQNGEELAVLCRSHGLIGGDDNQTSGRRAS